MNFNTFTVKANYYRLAKVYHPDRVEDSNKAVAQEKFANLRLAYSILVDPEKKKAYDAGDTDTLFEQTSIAGNWNRYIQKIDSASVLSARTKYQGSTAEQNDVAREFEIGKGSMTHLLNTIPFMRVEDEVRIIAMVKDSMLKGNVSKFAIRKIRS